MLYVCWNSVGFDFGNEQHFVGNSVMNATA